MNQITANSYALEKVASLIDLQPDTIKSLSDSAILSYLADDGATRAKLQVLNANPSTGDMAVSALGGGLLGSTVGMLGSGLLGGVLEAKGKPVDYKTIGVLGAMSGGLLGTALGIRAEKKRQAQAARDALVWLSDPSSK